METTTENLSNALLDVRRAHRILYAYQRRMSDLAYFIKCKLGMPDFYGFKHFSNPIYGRSKGHSRLNIWHDMWAWDYLYSYLFEYYLGVQKTSDEVYEYKFSLIQYSDTGYFDQDGQRRCRISEFGSEKESSSKLLFFLEYKSKDSEWEWKDGSYMERIVLNKEVGSKEHTKEVRRTTSGGTQILCSFPLERFINMEATLEVLREFRSYCKEQGIHVFDDLILEPTCAPTSSSSGE
ncbi:hypothetical protein [Porphyromonas catoniae]|uniref:Uncharacterized protein n=1 Tax=Porphyromonas catoniae ATCC 51270 TaxID=887901 RepID=Z4WPV1_9PORP|nr:hypothetical protein [Porphyromonas catoniae]EWC91621.1 hypothetical protein HMPREF0636_0335 [Porphyromonas catoniae ATCC 51270]